MKELIIKLKHQLIVVFVLLFSTLTLNNICAVQFYVDSTGADINPGTADAPLLTLEMAAIRTNPGDTVFIRGRWYHSSEPVALSDTGTEAMPIVYMASPGEQPVFDFSGSSLQTLPFTPGQAPGPADMGIISLFRCKFVLFEGVRLINSPSAGIQAYQSSHVAIKRCQTFNTYSSGVSAWDCDSVALDSNSVELACNLGPQECISVSRCRYFTVCGNEIFNTTSQSSVSGGEGIDCKEGSHHGRVSHNYVHHLHRQGLYIDSWNQHLSNIEMSDNIVHDCMYGFALSTEQPGGEIDSIFFHHNLIFNCRSTGIILTTWSDHDGPRRKVEIVNNTVVHCGWQRVSENGYPHGGFVIESKNTTNLVMRNNLFSDNCSFQMAYRFSGEPAFVNDYNLIDGYNDNPLLNHRREEISDNRGIVAINSFLNPEGPARFVNVSGADYSLLQSSLAINNGHPDVVYNDPNGTRNDIGAFPSDFLERDTITILFDKANAINNVYPNPARSLVLLGTDPDITVDEVCLQSSCGKVVGRWYRCSMFRVDEYPPGIYIIKIRNNGVTNTGKILVLK